MKSKVVMSQVGFEDESMDVYENVSKEEYNDEVYSGAVSKLVVVNLVDSSASTLQNGGNKAAVAYHNKTAEELANETELDGHVEIAMLGYDESAYEIYGFQKITELPQVRFGPRGNGTNTPAAFRRANEMILQQVKQLQYDGHEVLTPVIFWFTDGHSTVDMTSTIETMKDLARRKRVVVYGIGIGDDVNENDFKKICFDYVMVGDADYKHAFGILKDQVIKLSKGQNSYRFFNASHGELMANSNGQI